MSIYSKMTAIADAIREKTGGTNPLTLDAMAEAIARIEAGGGGEDSILDDFIAGNPIELYHKTESVAKEAFYYNPAIVSVNLPNCTTLGYRCFACCGNLTHASVPKVTTIGEWAFRQCGKLESIDTPLVTRVLASAFQDAKVAQIPNMENVTVIGNSSFRSCPLTEINLPSISAIDDWAFYGCAQLTKADLGAGFYYGRGNLAGQTFGNCAALETVIVRGTNLLAMQNVSALANTPIANGTGYIYVPRALVDSYKVATNWATYASQIRAIEDYPEICGEVSA